MISHMAPYGGALVRFVTDPPDSRVWIVVNKKGQMCDLEENLAVEGPRLTARAHAADLYVVVTEREVFRRRWFSA